MGQDRAALHARQLAQQKQMQQAAAPSGMPRSSVERQEQQLQAGETPRTIQMRQQQQSQQQG
jgi:hypothetical protein